MEGSRFGLRPADPRIFASTLILRNRVKASGSRERLNGFAALWPGVNKSEPAVNASRWVIRGSRLLRTLLRRLDVSVEIREVASHAPKRLPSRRRFAANFASAQGVSTPSASQARQRCTGRLKRVPHPEIHLHEIVSGLVDDAVIGFAKDADMRCEPVF